MSAAAQSIDPRPPRSVRLFLCGDVMTGRGLDQVLPHPCRPQTSMKVWSDRPWSMLALAEHAHGRIPRPVDPTRTSGAWLWRSWKSPKKPAARIINLETSITTKRTGGGQKGINYRMNPANVGVCRQPGVDCAVLANNHVLDWGESYLLHRDAGHARECLTFASRGAGRNVKPRRRCQRQSR